jgi:signal transduction histidine kinase
LNSADRSQLLQTLHGRRDTIAARWYQVIVSTSFGSLDAAEARQRLLELTEQAIALLVSEPFDRRAARAIGTALARLHYIQPEALGRTQEVLANQLAEALSADQIVTLQSRLAAVLGELAVGFFEQAHEIMLTEQEQIRRALVTKLERAGEELRKFRDRLEELVGERTGELMKAIGQLEREIIERQRMEETLRQRTVELEARNEELDAFAHTVAHDLKSPVCLITGYVEFLEQHSATMPEEELFGYLRMIAESGYGMSNIIDELLLLAGVRKMEVETMPLDMTRVVDHALQRLAYMIEEYQAEIILPDTWPVALGYAPWIEEVWINYLSNAIKYGGQPPYVELGAMVQSDHMVRFWMRDNGPGLTPEEQGRLFTPFKRLDQVRFRGHGLGLSIVRRIVEKLGGQVGVESEVDRGCVFSFTLPGAAG